MKITRSFITGAALVLGVVASSVVPSSASAPAQPSVVGQHFTMAQVAAKMAPNYTTAYYYQWSTRAATTAYPQGGWRLNDALGGSPYLVFQSDRNLVDYKDDGYGGVIAVWASGTQCRCTGGHLLGKTNGNLDILDSGGHVIWSNNAYENRLRKTYSTDFTLVINALRDGPDGCPDGSYWAEQLNLHYSHDPAVSENYYGWLTRAYYDVNPADSLADCNFRHSM